MLASFHCACLYVRKYAYTFMDLWRARNYRYKVDIISIPVKFSRHIKVGWLSSHPYTILCIRLNGNCNIQVVQWTCHLQWNLFLLRLSVPIPYLLCTATMRSDDFALLLSLQIFYNKHAAWARRFILRRCIPFYKNCHIMDSIDTLILVYHFFSRFNAMLAIVWQPVCCDGNLNCEMIIV